MRTIVLSMAIGLLIANVTIAGDSCTVAGCCDPGACCQAQDGCGGCGCRKVCKVVCEMKQVKKHVWVVECEEFCAPLPGLGRGCAPCGDAICEPGYGEDGCGGEGRPGPCASLYKPMVPPKCGKVRCRKKLVKKEVTCEVPVYRCVVVCGGGGPGCREEPCGANAEQDGAREVPKPPLPNNDVAPLPPIVGTSYLESLTIRP